MSYHLNRGKLRYFDPANVIAKVIGVVILMWGNFTFSETIPGITVENCRIDGGWFLPDNKEVMEKTLQDICKLIDLPPTDVPGGTWCVNRAGNPVYIESADICADGSLKRPINSGRCDIPVSSCPNSTWTLSEDKQTCWRPEGSCWKDTENISELKLLAAIAYGEASVDGIYEEMAGIASATIRKRDAAPLCASDNETKIR